MLTRIGALLRKAEATDNEHEADAFLAAAQRLATQSSIDLAVARAHIADRERRPVPVQRAISIGEPGKRGLRTYVQLFVAIARANDVRCDVATNSTRVFAYGFDTDIDTCQALYTSLVVQMVRACDSYLKTGQHRPVATVTARLNFQLAFADRIGARLARARAETERQVLTDSVDTPGTALALREKDVELTDFYHRTSTARGHWRGARDTLRYAPHAAAAGDRAGRVARLGHDTAIGGVRGELSS